MKKPRKRKEVEVPEGLGVKTYRVELDEDFIVSKEYGNSLENCLNANPDGVSNVAACKFLSLDVKEHEIYLKEAERTIRQFLEN